MRLWSGLASLSALSQKCNIAPTACASSALCCDRKQIDAIYAAKAKLRLMRQQKTNQHRRRREERERLRSGENVSIDRLDLAPLSRAQFCPRFMMNTSGLIFGIDSWRSTSATSFDRDPENGNGHRLA